MCDASRVPPEFRRRLSANIEAKTKIQVPVDHDPSGEWNDPTRISRASVR